MCYCGGEGNLKFVTIVSTQERFTENKTDLSEGTQPTTVQYKAPLVSSTKADILGLARVSCKQRTDSYSNPRSKTKEGLGAEPRTSDCYTSTYELRNHIFITAPPPCNLCQTEQHCSNETITSDHRPLIRKGSRTRMQSTQIGIAAP